MLAKSSQTDYSHGYDHDCRCSIFGRSLFFVVKCGQNHQNVSYCKLQVTFLSLNKTKMGSIGGLDANVHHRPAAPQK